jgi:hypothetical protein
MTTTLVQPSTGRGAWNKKGVGGTLNLDGTGPGEFYRAPAGSSKMIGSATSKKVKAGDPVDANDYAVWRAVVAIQTEIEVLADGIFGNDTAAALKAWQTRNGIGADGIFGQGSAKKMFQPLLQSATGNISGAHKDLYRAANGHTWSESSLDPGCVGPTTPEDLGLCQINGRWHPDMTAAARLDPRAALRWQAQFVQDNLEAMGNNTRDGIAAYLLGVGGAKQWVASGRPDVWVRKSPDGVVQSTIQVKTYVDNVWKNGTL